MKKTVKCVICGKEAPTLAAHLRVHGIKTKEYREKYNAPTASEEWIEKIRKRALENNPMHKPEVRKKLSENCSMKNPEVAKRNAEARRGAKRTAEQKERISEGRKGKGTGQKNAMKRPDVVERNKKANEGKKIKTDEMKRKISEARKGKGLGNRNAMKRPEVKEKVFQQLRGCKRPEMSGDNNPMRNPAIAKKITGSGNGRWGKPSHVTTGNIKRYEHESPIAGKVIALGTYELRMCKILDNLGWYWEKEPDHFEYINIEGKPATYTPDFKVLRPDGTTLYIETKGYYPENDQRKCTTLQNQGIKLLVLTQKLLDAFEKGVMG